MKGQRRVNCCPFTHREDRSMAMVFYAMLTALFFMVLIVAACHPDER